MTQLTSDQTDARRIATRIWAQGLGRAPVLILVLAGLIALVVAPVLANAEGRSPVTVATWAAGTVWAATVLGLCITGWVSRTRKGDRRTFVGSTIVSLILLGGVFLPGASLVWRTRTANVERLLGTPIATDEKLTFAFVLAAAVLAAFLIGEALAIKVQPPSAEKLPYDWRKAHAMLYTVGFLSTAPELLTRNVSDSFAERGTDSGVGLLVLASWCLPLAAAIAVSQRHWGSKLRLASTALAIVMLVAAGVRSPLLLIAIAALPRLIEAIAASRFSAPRWVGLATGAYIVLTTAAAISSWRGGIRAGLTPNFFDELLRHAINPNAALTSSGIDTLDGMLLVQSVDTQQFNPSMLDLLKVFTMFIPRQIFPDKPPLLSNTISQSVLDFGVAGMFLSGPGYLLVISGSMIAVLALFAAGGFTFNILTGVVADVGGAVLSYTLLRFVMGGDAFDFYQGLTLVLLLVVSRITVAVASRFHGRLTRTGIAGVPRATLSKSS